MMNKHTIDASGQTLGRVSSRVAFLLMGKDSSSFARNLMPKNTVEVLNGSRLKIPAKKLLEKRYHRFSGYPGGGKSETLNEIIEKRGVARVLQKAVYGMLPKNRLRNLMIKNLTIRN